MSPYSTFSLLLLTARALADFDLGWEDDSDLTKFVTRPEIRAPKFNVSIYDQSRVAPGYWFVAPYAHIFQHTHAPKYYQACQTGPAIYDNDGELVWSGACMVRNQNAFDFRPWEFNGTQYLSILHGSFADVGDRKGHGIMLDNSYTNVQNVWTPKTLPGINMHELNIFDEGRKALYLMWDPARLPLDDLELKNLEVGWVADMGFHEIDLTTGDVLFEWWANRAGHVSLNESRQGVHDLDGPWPKAWNWFHGNSVEKNIEGDYILSSRYTDTIFKISGENGAVLWRLGGFRSSFKQDFTFSGQHDARTRFIDDKTEIISFLNNNSDDDTEIANTSVAVVVKIDRKQMTASLISEIPRPDGNLTRLRGNHQILPNDNHFICWSENSYLSEHAPGGELLMEASFASRRFVTYRGYKFNFTSTPIEPPAVVGQVHGTSPTQSITTIFMSWNGATEVSTWKFYGERGSEDDTKFRYIGSTPKTGFETISYVPGYYSAIYAEALDGDGKILGVSEHVIPSTPKSWGTDESPQNMIQSAAQVPADVHAQEAGSHEDSLLQHLTTVSVHSRVVYIAGIMELVICFALAISYFRPRRSGPPIYRRVSKSWL